MKMALIADNLKIYGYGHTVWLEIQNTVTKEKGAHKLQAFPIWRLWEKQT